MIEIAYADDKSQQDHCKNWRELRNLKCHVTLFRLAEFSLNFDWKMKFFRKTFLARTLMQQDKWSPSANITFRVPTFSSQVNYIEKKAHNPNSMNESVLTLLLMSCIKDQRWDEHEKVETLISKHFEPPFSMSIYVNLVYIFGKAKKYQKILEITNQMQKDGAVLGDRIYYHIFNFFMEAHYDADLFRFLLDIVQNNIELDPEIQANVSSYVASRQGVLLEKFSENKSILNLIYSILVMHYQHTDEAVFYKLLKDVIQNQVVLSNEISKMILKKFQEETNELFEIFYRIHVKSYPDDFDVFQYSLNYYISIGDPHKFNYVMKQVYEHKVLLSTFMIQTFEKAAQTFYWEELTHFLYESPMFDKNQVVQEKFIQYDLDNFDSEVAFDRVLKRISVRENGAILRIEFLNGVWKMILEKSPGKASKFLEAIANHSDLCKLDKIYVIPENIANIPVKAKKTIYKKFAVGPVDEDFVKRSLENVIESRNFVIFKIIIHDFITYGENMLKANDLSQIVDFAVSNRDYNDAFQIFTLLSENRDKFNLQLESSTLKSIEELGLLNNLAILWFTKK